MIVNSNLIAAIGIGSDAAMPQPEDAQLVIPPTLVPSLLFTTPMVIDVSTVIPQTTSFMEANENVHTNLAANSITLATLARGLWEITFNVSAWFNYDSAGAGGDFVAYRLISQPSTVLSNVISFAARQGLFMFSTNIRVLLQQETTINRRNPTNGVGQTIQNSVSIIANKIV